jgi:HEPN domain-containing protein
MPHDPERLDEATAWLAKACEDLRAAELLLTATPPLTGTAAYHTQQAAEKALKAFLSWHDTPFRKTHDLAELGQVCIEVDRSLEDLCRSAETLTVYAWLFRYPGDEEDLSEDEARSAVNRAREVYDGIASRVPRGTHLAE